MPAGSHPTLHDLADAAGIARRWRDVDGNERDVTGDVLVAILQALGHRSGSSRQIVASLTELAQQNRALPAMLVGEVDTATLVATAATSADVTGEDGITKHIAIKGGLLPPIAEPGYYDLAIGGETIKLAIAPRQCPLPRRHGRRMWGTAAQIPALRGGRASPFGNFGDLANAAEALGHRGCDALAINPVHALFPGCGDDFSPYSPSSRIFLNTAMGDPALLGLPGLPEGMGSSLIDWPGALPARLTELRHIFDGLDVGRRAQIGEANAVEGPALLRHATFDALDCRFRPRGAKGWQDWPARFRDPGSAAVTKFARDNADDIEFHLFAQWLSREGLGAAQKRARASGMTIGLVADLAVGVQPGGSDAWAMPQAMLRGLTIGAPPDPLGPLGQNWSITGFSPAGLRETGYAPWIAMLRSALRSAGGLRIDHAFGLARLWVIPDGAESSDGAYLTFPFLDLVRLVTLEAHRAGALIIAEDLGTSPPGFTQAVTERHMLGMRVLWFERAADNGFIGAQDYPADSVAMTGTHDTPTVAGWWSGRDLDWAAKLGRFPEGVDRAKAEEIRDWDRGLLWSTLAIGGGRPAPDNPAPVVDAALAHVGRSPALLAMAPLEDLLGEIEQPNLPGTVSEHPNWQRRLPAPLDELLARPEVAARLDAISGSN